MKLELWQLRQRQALPLEIKVRMTEHRIRQWYQMQGGLVYVAFSGGKDSTVLLHIARKLYPEIPAVFMATGLQYPEIVAFVKSIENVEFLRPTKLFNKVIVENGYPVVSKKVARFVRDLQNASERNRATCNLRLTGMNRAGVFCPSMMLSQKWRYLVDAPFKISEQCCDYLKKYPAKKYVRRTGRVPLIGTMAVESQRREQNYLRQGCMITSAKSSQCLPLAFWTEQDILQYLLEYDVPYATIYGEIEVVVDDKYCLTGVSRTGCVFCMFGVHFDSSPNRFQRLKVSHPYLYNYCIDKLQIGQVLDYIGVDY